MKQAVQPPRISYARDQGPRENLEDDMGAFQMTLLPAKLLVTALGLFDGVGGNVGGEVASRQGAITLSSYLTACITGWDGSNPSFLSEANLRKIVIDALHWANQTILQHIDQQPTLKGMSTTAVVALLVDHNLIIGWAGDSRGYLYRKGKITPLTTDHSEVQPLIEAGLLSIEQAHHHPLAHMINRYLGQPQNFQPECRSLLLEPEDIVLLCSDGLTDVLADEQIASTITRCLEEKISFDQIPQILMRQALTGGTRDNVTVLCCQYQPNGQSDVSLLGLTLTGEYPAAVAKALARMHKE